VKISAEIFAEEFRAEKIGGNFADEFRRKKIGGNFADEFLCIKNQRNFLRKNFCAEKNQRKFLRKNFVRKISASRQKTWSENFGGKNRRKFCG
jgi:hypothetical protein